MAWTLLFVRSGYISLVDATGALKDVGQSSFLWSSRSDVATSAYNLGFAGEGVNVSSYGRRYYAFPPSTALVLY